MQAVLSRPAIPRPWAPLARFFALLGLCAGLASAHAWSLDDVAKLARERANTPRQQERPALPAELVGMEYDALRDIRFKDDKALW
ncbi:MAG: glucan biosynthesis protein, partial [Polaromonas sp.]